MTREEILQTAKPMLFNTDMVRAILDDRKTATRRIAKYITQFDDEGLYFNIFKKGEWIGPISREQAIEEYAPCKVGDILYVRETWTNLNTSEYPCYYYKASDELPEWALKKWHPSIHMPKEAARIFLRVTDVRVERLQDIDDEGAKAEGSNFSNGKNVGLEEKMRRCAVERFTKIWDATVQKKDLGKYGWEANPWVWVIEFERCEIAERRVIE